MFTYLFIFTFIVVLSTHPQKYGAV